MRLRITPHGVSRYPSSLNWPTAQRAQRSPLAVGCFAARRAFWVVGGQRQADDEFGVAGSAVHQNGAVMGFDHRRHNRQPESGAAALARARRVTASETLEHLRL